MHQSTKAVITTGHRICISEPMEPYCFQEPKQSRVVTHALAARMQLLSLLKSIKIESCFKHKEGDPVLAKGMVGKKMYGDKGAVK